ncbi:MAG: acyl-CoA dehydratase activase-related protein [Thermacetogeniaceae bacterium]
MIRIGIPRALLYYMYIPLWRAFFTELGAEVVVSPGTNKAILDAGLQSALDEACLPVKLFFGHTTALAGMVDYLFVPRLISIEPKAYICPKFMGLPDMLRARIHSLPPLIDVSVDFSKGNRDWYSVLSSAGRKITGDSNLIRKAYSSARTAQCLFQEQLEAEVAVPEAIERMTGETVPGRGGQAAAEPVSLSIALLGHAYNIYDDYISMNLIQRLRSLGAQVITADCVSQQTIAEQAAKLPKKLFWSLGRKMVGAALAFYDSSRFDGMIYLSSFGCGPESLVGELIARWARRRSDLPFMMLTIDEHSGTAGMITRLEAFTDMLKRRKKDEDHLPAHGQPVYSSQGVAVQTGDHPGAATAHLQENC